MNRNQIKGTLKVAIGTVEQATGKLLGRRKLQLEGIGKQVAGRARTAVGDIEETVKDAGRT